MAWHGLSLQANGGIRPCCRYSIVHPVENPSSPEQSSALKQIRKQMLEGEIPEGCVRCKEDEASGIRSKRLRSQKWFTKDPDSEDAGEIRVVEFSIGNLCNARCLMCSSHLSSAWNQEVDKIGHQKSPIYPGDESRILAHLTSIRELEVIGGETFLGEHFLRLLRAIDQSKSAQNIVLKLVTNLSVFPGSETLELLKKFKRVELFGSIDGFRDRNTFIRFPIRWDVLEQNVLRYLEWSQNFPQVRFSMIHSSSALSFGTLPQLLEWWESILKIQNISSEDRMWFNSVIDPQYQALNVLPLEFRYEVVEQLKKNRGLPSVEKVLEMESYLLEPQRKDLFPKLLDLVKKFQYRSSDPVEKVFPELFGSFELKKTDSQLPVFF